MTTLAGSAQFLQVDILRPLWQGASFDGGSSTHLVLWYFKHWLQHRIGQLIGRLRMAIVVRDEECVGSDGAYHQCGGGHFAPARAYRHPVAILNTQPLRRLLMYLHPGVRGHLFQERHAPRLVARQVMIDDAPRSQHQWVLLIRFFGGRNIGDGMEACLAIGETEALFVKARRAGMILIGARPEDTVLLLNLLVSDAPVVRFRSFCAEPQFIEDVARRVKIEVLPFAQATRQFADNLPVAPRLARGINSLVIFDNAALQRGYSAFVLGPHIARENNIGQFRRLGEEEISHDEEIQVAQRSLDRVLVGQRYHWIGADHEAGANLLAQHGRNHQRGGVASVWQVLLVDTPYLTDIRTIFRVFNLAATGKL